MDCFACAANDEQSTIFCNSFIFEYNYTKRGLVLGESYFFSFYMLAKASGWYNLMVGAN
jgi:hypothetical protein